MPSEDDRDRALRRIVEYTEAMGNSIAGEAEGQTDDGRPLSGYRVQQGNHTLVVATVPGWEYFTVLYQYDVAKSVAVRRAVGEQAPSGGGEVQIELDQAGVEAAADDLRAHVGDADLAALRMEFIQSVSSVAPQAGIDIDVDGSLIRGFKLQTKLFPYREGFDVADYADRVQETVTAGWVAKEFLVDAYDLGELVDAEFATGSSDGEPAMFQ